MTIFQKLSWMVQMGIHNLCDEKPHSMKKKSVMDGVLSNSDKALTSSKSALSATATHPLGGVGMVPAEIMCVLEMPSSMEDRTGQALSGPEGELLKKMLQAIGLDTNVQTYIAYLSPWRSPGARVLTPSETQEGLALLNKKIQIVHPKVLLLIGMPVVRAMINVPLGQARTKVHYYQDIPVFATFAPNFLLKNVAYKKGAWDDLKKLQTFLNKK